MAFRRSLAGAVWLAAGMLRTAEAAPVLTSAEVAITFSAPAVCEVTLTVAITEAADVEHRLEVLDGSRVELLEVTGAAPARDPHDIGRTLAVRMAPTTPGEAYALRYRVTQEAAHRDRCPLWLPTVPTDGRSRPVRIAVTVPDGATASATLPAFTWTGARGTASLAHLPAIVIVPFALAGQPRPWDISRAMDVTAIATLVGATAVWLRRQRRPR